MKELKWNKIRAGFISLLVLLLITNTVIGASKTAFTKPQAVIDDETVYALLSADGKVKQTVVVDWLRVKGGGSLQVYDVRPEGKIETLKGTPEPEEKDNLLIFKTDANSFKDLYYQVETTKELPLDFEIKYELDGKEVKPSELAGKNGHLKVSVKIINKLKHKAELEYLNAEDKRVQETTEVYTPLFTVVSLNLDSSKFDNIKIENGWLSAQGSKFSLSWFAFPQGEAEISFEADGKDIEIPSMIISAMPRLPQEVKLDMAEEFEQLYKGLNGLAALSDAHYMILNNLASKIDPSSFAKMSGVQEQFSQLGSAMNQTKQGVDGLAQLTDGQIMLLNNLIQSLDTTSLADLSQLSTGIAQIKDGLISIKSGVDALNGAVNAYAQLVDQSYQLNLAAQQKANLLASETTDTSTASELIGLLKQQEDILLLLKSGGEITPGNTIPSISDFGQNLSSLSSSLDQLINALSQIQAGMSSLSSLPQNLETLKASLIALRDGGSFYGNYMPGLSTVKNSLTQISGAMELFGNGISQAATSMKALESLPDALLQIRSTIEAVASGGSLMGKTVPGITTSKTGLQKMAEGIGTGLKEMRKGSAFQDLLKSEADKYDTFLGRYTDKEYSGRVRFIFKVEAVEKK